MKMMITASRMGRVREIGVEMRSIGLTKFSNLSVLFISSIDSKPPLLYMANLLALFFSLSLFLSVSFISVSFISVFVYIYLSLIHIHTNTHTHTHKQTNKHTHSNTQTHKHTGSNKDGMRNKEVLEMQAVALAQDADIFDYDGAYDSFKKQVGGS